MTQSSPKYESPLESYLRPNSYIFWQNRTYRIVSRELRTLAIEDILLSEQESRTIKIVDLVVPEDENPPVFAPTLDRLRQKLATPYPSQSRSADANLPQSFRDKAQDNVRKYKMIETLLAEKKDEVEKSGDIFNRADELKTICQRNDIGISVATYYNYRNTYRRYKGDLSAIAATFRRSRSFGHTRLDDPQIHFVDSAIVRYYMCKPPIRKATLYEFIKSTYKHTQGQWIDPGKCVGSVPQDLVIQLFDDKLPIQALQENAEKARLLVPIKEPKRTWVYDRAIASK